MKIPKPTSKYMRSLAVYRHFAQAHGVRENKDDAQRQFVFESHGPQRYQQFYGQPFDENTNFYAVGKKWKEWHITNWLEDLQSDKPFLFAAWELWQDYAEKPHMIEMLESAIYPNLTLFQKSMVDDWKTAYNTRHV